LIKEIICDKCNKKCILSIDKCYEVTEVSGNLCNIGMEYAYFKINDNKDVLTTLVRIKGANNNVVPVKSTKPLDKKLWIECSKALSRLYVGAPIKEGDIVCKNILNTGVDIVCTKTMIRFNK
jgi:CxxC motif-containing protein